MMKINQLYKIIWYDIEHDNEWNEITKEFEIPEPKVNVWYYWGKKKNFYFFGSGKDSTSHFERVAVPKACIIKTEQI